MRRRFIPAALLLLLLVHPAAALAQRTTGNIIGVVTDNTGGVLPGVTVTLKSSSIIGTQTAVTDERGGYRFPALPPGSYDLSFSVQGFSTLNREQIPVGVGTTVEINVELGVSQLAETVTVTGESPVVDTSTTQVSTNYNREWVENAPVRRFTFFDLINAAPGVSQALSTSSRSTSFGSGTTDNSYQLDGTDFTAPLTGAAWPWPNTDAIEEVEVLSLGASAEYGNLMGAVFNVVTRQGSNTFHGDWNLYYQHQNLTGRNTDEDVDGGLPYNRDRFIDTTAQLGGPVIKDKFWFFGSYQFQQDYESQPGVDPAFPARSQAKRVFFKLNYQINNDNKLMFAYHDDYYRIPGRATALNAPSTIGVENGHNPSPNLTWTSVLSPKTFIEARYSGFYGKDHGDPLEANEPRVKPRYWAADTGEITGGIYSWYDGISEKTAFAGKISHYAENFLGGTHDVKLGVQYNSGGSDYALGPNDYIYTYYGVPYIGYTQVPWHQGGHMNAIGIYADDTYRLGSRLSFNLGLRYDYNKASFESFPVLDKQGGETGQSTPSVDKLFSWNVVSPRAGFNFKLTEDGKTVVKAHYGRYYRGIVTGEFDNVGPSLTPRFSFSGFYDAAGNPIGPLDLVSDNTNLSVDPDFKDPYTDQFIIGFERELMRNLAVNASYIHKRGERPGGYQDAAGQYVPAAYVDNRGADATGATIPVFRLVSPNDERLFQLTNPANMFSRYNGLSVQVNKRMAQRWQMVASLVISKSEGRLGSSLGSPTASQTSTAGTFGQNPNDFVNTDGRLIGDRPVIFKTQLVYEFPFGITTAANFTHQSGRPWARQVRPSGLGISPATTILAEPLTGDRRVADWNVLDLRIQKAFNLGRDANVAFFGDILNLTNDDAHESVLSRLGTSSSFGLPARFIYPRRLMIGTKVRF